jgi:hypothetical protein
MEGRESIGEKTKKKEARRGYFFFQKTQHQRGETTYKSLGKQEKRALYIANMHARYGRKYMPP